MNEKYRRKYTFGEDYGTSFYKLGPIILMEKPEVIENRGYFPDKSSIMYKMMGVSRDIIVGKRLPSYLEAKEELTSRLIYPMRNGVVDKDDEKAWKVIEEITRYGLEYFRPRGSDFKGYYVCAALSAVAPRYMYEKIIDIHKKIGYQTRLVRALTIVSQPLAVAIAHKAPTCIVIESGHGNTQFCPISRYPIRSAVIALNRGGSDADIITSQILYDAGYGDIAKEEAIVRRIKEGIGLIPKDLDEAIRESKRNYEKYRAKYKIAGTRIEIDLEKDSWARFLIGEYIFNPKSEIFESYFKRGMQRPKDVKIGEVTFKGMIDFSEAIIEAVEKCPIELQPYLYNRIILSGGNLQWKVPPQYKNVAVDAKTKIKILLQEKGIEEVIVEVAPEPKYSVWRGCIVYGYALPEDYTWTWENMEGWIKIYE